MKKAISIMLACAMIILCFSGCGSNTDTKGKDGSSGSNDSDYSYHWKLATTETADYYMAVLAQDFIDLVNERTNGKVTGEVFASGQLGGLVDALEGLELGTVDIVMDGFSSLGEVNPIFDAWGMPYLYDSREHRYNFWDNYFDECAELVADEANIRMVTVLDGLNRNLCTTQPVYELKDLKGLKIRVPTITTYMRVWECFGTAPVPMALSEVYTSIQNNVVQGQENDIMLTMSMNFYEVAPYAIMTEHVPYEGSLFFNEETFQSYPEELQQIILDVGKEITEKSRTVIAAEEEKTLQEMEDMGVTIIRPDLEEFKAATAVTQSTDT
ncbi:MAG: TRAP transporter substrate-binding protein [Lawsonibacter sp.]|jgi:tripartite ATP-independent transporter DctP family solute receptor